MKKNKILLSMILILIIISLFIVGCGSQKSQDIFTSEPSMEDFDSSAGTEENYNEFENQSSLEPEKVITNIYMHFETMDFTATQKNLAEIVAKHDSYVENSDVRYNSYYNSKNFRYASYIIRVPKDKISAFKDDLRGVGNIISENTNKTDVTKEYNDNKSRFNILETKEERLLKLLEKAEKIEDIIALENQLNEVVYEKENLKSKLLNIDDKVDFSTINLEIEEVERLRNMETIETDFGLKVKNAFTDSLYRFKIAFQSFIIWLIYFLPFALILILLGFILFMIFKKIRK